jgi:mannosyl-oligosaccharide glucosidase
MIRGEALFVDILKDETQSNRMVPNEPGVGNVHFMQMVFQDEFEFDVLYSSRAATREMTGKTPITSVE